MLAEVAFTLDAMTALAEVRPDLRLASIAREAAELRDKLKITAVPRISVRPSTIRLPEQLPAKSAAAADVRSGHPQRT